MMAEHRSGMGLLPEAGSTHLLEEGMEAMFEWLDLVNSSGYHSLLLTRLPPRRLIGKIDINTVEVGWLTERDSPSAVSPSLERLAMKIRERISEKSGIIVLDGVEHLMSLHGFAAVLTFLRSMSDDISSTAWRLVCPVEPKAFLTTEIARLRREAPVWELPEAAIDEVIIHEEEVEVSQEVVETTSEVEVHEDGSAKLSHLTRLPSAGFTTAILRRRILAWRRMGFDVSELEPALKYQDMEHAYALYRVVEEKVRLAIELDRRVDLLMSRGDISNGTAFRFRIRQLTGIREVWNSLDILLDE